MLIIYLAGLATGGLLLVFSFVGGHDGADGDGDVDAEADVEADVETDGEGEGDADADGEGPSQALALTLAALPFASLRFWTFFLAFGGLAGTLLTWLSGLGAVATMVVAGAVGYGAGVGLATFMRWLRKDQVSSTLDRDQCVGVSGTVLLPVGRGALGRIRVRLENQLVDFDAETEDEADLDVSEPVVVYEVRDDGVVLVTSTRTKVQS